MWPLIKLLPVKTNFKFVGYSGFMGMLSAILVILSLAALVTGGLRQNPAQIWAEAGPAVGDKVMAFACTGFNCGVDFKGGTLLEVKTQGAPPIGALRAKLDDLGLKDPNVQEFGGAEGNAALLRFASPEGGDPLAAVDGIKAELRAAFPGLEITRSEVVGPKVSGELFEAGALALGVAIILMLIYIWFRFELNYGMGAVLALFHDVILTMGLMSVTRIEFSLTSIAALLTVIGYSMNDTVVVYDRMRENRRKYKKMGWAELIDVSLNETFSRTVVTGGTGLLALTGLMLLGGPVMFAFSFAMIFGIVIGTYSSIYVAAPALLVFGEKVVDKSGAEKDASSSASAGAAG
jgi:preprotein translocase SecF subunit